MTLNFVIPEFNINGAGTPPLQFYKRGFVLNGSSGGSPSYRDIILSGNTALTLVNSKANGLNYLKLFGGCEQTTALPDGYTQLASINFTSGCYFNTGIVINSLDAYVKLIAKFDKPPDASPHMMWGFMGSSNNLPRWGVGTYSGKWLTSPNATGQFASIDTNLHIFETLLYDNSGTPYYQTIIDNVVGVNAAWSSTETMTANTLPIYIGARNNNGTAGNFSGGDFTYLEVIQKGVCSARIYACKRNSDNALGLYNTITNEFLTNLGTGTVTAGSTTITPSPYMSIPIKCNNGEIKYGQYGKNLFNKATFDFSTSTTLKYVPIYVGDGTFTMSTPDFGVETSANLFFLAGSVDTGANSRINGVWTNNAITQTAIDGYVTVATRTGSSALNKNPADYSWQIEVGSTATSYEPYHIGTYTDGTVETVEVHGKNYFDKNAENVILDGFPTAAGKWSSSTSFRSICYKLNEMQTYTITRVTSSPSSAAMRVVAYSAIPPNDEEGTPLFIGANAVKTATITVPAGKPYIMTYVKHSADDITNQALLDGYQIELGTTATAYEPYYNGGSATAVNLLCVLNKSGQNIYAQDVQNVTTGAVTRNVGVKVFDGTETWVKATNTDADGNNVFYSVVADRKTGDTNIGMFCTHYVFKGTVSYSTLKAGEMSILQSAGNVYFDGVGYTTVDDFKAYLAQQYANGTPVIVLYPLATATTETVTPQPLTIQAGTNIVEITQASMDNLELEVSYKAGVEVTVTEIENAQLDNSVEVTING